MTFSFLWAPLAHHVGHWTTPGDAWGTFRDAHLVGWGGEGILYASNTVSLTGYISLPAMPVGLAPIAALSGALHLSENLPLTLARPTAWLLLGPVELAAGASALFPLDALAGRLAVPRRRRMALVWIESALIWPVVAIWGHPEDLVALGLGVYALMGALDGRWRRGALCLGAAIAFQPLVVVLVPTAVALAPWRRWLAVTGLSAAPSAILLVAPLVHAGSTTMRVLIDQPTIPALNHPTPWLALSHVLQRANGQPSGNGAIAHLIMQSGQRVVAGGPVRLIPLCISVVIGAMIVLHRPGDSTIWWLAAVALGARCLFEAVMTPYYVVPALAIAFILASCGSRLRFLSVALAGIGCILLSYRHAETWSYFAPVTIALLTTLVVSNAPSWVPPLRRLVERDRAMSDDANLAVTSSV